MTPRINLLPTRERRALRRRRRILALATALFLTGTALGAANVAQCRQHSRLASDLAAARAAAAALRPDARAARKLETRIQEQQRRNAAVIEWLAGRAQPARALRSLSEAAPATLWLTRYAESDGAAVLEGQAIDDASITRFLRDLPDPFSERRLVEAGRAAGGESLRRFVIQARTLPLPDAPPPGG